MPLTSLEAKLLALAAEADDGAWLKFSFDMLSVAAANRLADLGHGEVRQVDDPRSIEFRPTRQGREALAGNGAGERLDGVDARVLALAAEQPDGIWTRFSDGASSIATAARGLAALGFGDFRHGEDPAAIEFRANELGRAEARVEARVEAAEPRAGGRQALSVGIGTLRCGEIPVNEQDKALQWAFGYWSGLNEAAGRSVGDEVDPRAIADDLFDRCGRNPQAKMYEVVAGLCAEYLRANR